MTELLLTKIEIAKKKKKKRKKKKKKKEKKKKKKKEVQERRLSGGSIERPKAERSRRGRRLQVGGEVWELFSAVISQGKTSGEGK